MGSDAKDFDNDGNVDIFYNNLRQQVWQLLRNDGHLFSYAYSSKIQSMSIPHSGWSNGFIDYNNDVGTHEIPQLRHALHRRTIDGQHDIALTDAGLGRTSGGIFHHKTAGDAELGAFVWGERTQLHAEMGSLRRCLAILGDGCGVRRADGCIDRHELAVTHDLEGRVLPGAVLLTRTDNWPASAMGLPLNLRITSPT